MRRRTAALSVAIAVGSGSLIGLAYAFASHAPARDLSLDVPVRSDAVALHVPKSFRALARGPVIRSQAELLERAEALGLRGAWYAVTVHDHFADGRVLPFTNVRRLGLKPSEFEQTRAVLEALDGRPGVVHELRAQGDTALAYGEARVVEIPEGATREDPMEVLGEMLDPDEMPPEF